MTPTVTMTEALQAISDVWEARQEITIEDICSEAEVLPISIPTDLLAFYKHGIGGYIHDVEVFSLHELIDVNQDRRFVVEFPSAFFFAGDGGGGWYFFDTQNDMGFGVGAIFKAARGSMRYRTCVYCSSDISEFFLEASTEEPSWLDRDDLARQEANDVVSLLDSNARSWKSEDPASYEDMNTLMSKIGGSLPYALKILWMKSNGVLFPASGVRLMSTDEASALGSPNCDEAPSPLVIIATRETTQYAMTTYGWCDVAGERPKGEGLMVALEAGETIENAKMVGLLSELVKLWLEGLE